MIIEDYLDLIAQLGDPNPEQYHQAAELHNNLASLYHRKSESAQALVHYAKALQYRPDYMGAHINLGLLFLQQENLAAAKKQFNNIIALSPQHKLGHVHLGDIALAQGELDQAKHHYTLVLQQDPENSQVWSNLGALALKAQEPQTAIHYFTQALAFDNDSLIARANLAAVFMQHNRFENALRHYEELRKAQPDNIDMHYNMGVATMALGYLDQASEHFEHVLSLQPGHAASWNNLGAIYLRQHQRERAIDCFKKTLNYDPNNISARYMLAALVGTEEFKAAPGDYVQGLFDNYAQNYEAHVLTRLSYQVPDAMMTALEQVTDLELANWRILDLGCGTGLMGERCGTFAKTLIGVDLAKNMLALAEKKDCYQDLHQVDILGYLERPQPAADLILAADVLGYFGDLTSFFAACQKRLKVYGFLAFSVEISDDKPYVLQPTARFAHAVSAIKHWAKDTGFCVRYCEKTVGRIQAGEPLYVNIVVCEKFSD